jgi:2-iminobutanoate/2-iminopropanoate deaminase
MPAPTPVSVPGLPPVNNTFSQAMRLGDVVYVSGQLGIDPATGHLKPGGAVAEYRRALENLRMVLEAAGSSLDRVVKTTVFMTDMGQLGPLNDVYAEFFPHRPAKTGVEVNALALGAHIEIEAIAGV